MNRTRRDLLKLAVGGAQLGLLHRLGALEPSRAHAQTVSGPTKLLTLYVDGGWIPQFGFCPVKLSETDTLLPTPRMVIGGGEPFSYTAQHVAKNLDGTTATDSGDWNQRPLRFPRLWDEASLSQGRRDGRVALAGAPGLRTSALGYSWAHYQLWKYASVLHGVDMGTAAHDSGRVSMMCGVAGPNFASPALHAFVANAMLSRFPDRVLPYVSLGGPVGERVRLPATTAALGMRSRSSMSLLFSERDKHPSGSWYGWGSRTAQQLPKWDGSPGPTVAQNRLESFIDARARKLAGRTGPRTDALYQSIVDGYRGYSTVLAKDVVTKLEATPGYQYINQPGPNFPFWSENGFMGFNLGSSVAEGGGGVTDVTSLALTVLKSDLTTAVSLEFPSKIGFDTHNDGDNHFPYLRGLLEQVGRLLGEMSLTPSSTPGRTLLDDTLVLVMSEFGRTWNREGGTDHWPANSVIFAGGNGMLAPNRMVGGFDTSTGITASTPGYLGLPVPMKGEDGRPMTTPRAPQSRDVVYTALKLFGIDEFLPGGPGDVTALHV